MVGVATASAPVSPAFGADDPEPGEAGDLDEGRRGDGLTTQAHTEPRELKRENRRLRMERDIPRKSRRPVREGERIDPRRGYAFMEARRATFPPAVICRVPGLSPRG